MEEKKIKGNNKEGEGSEVKGKQAEGLGRGKEERKRKGE